MGIRNSIFSALSRSSNVDKQQTERIKAAMLNSLDGIGKQAYDSVKKSIERAIDIETLWYLRPDLFHAISQSHDQSSATTALTKITTMFVGHLPIANSTRFIVR
jgi:hypothetical protein